MFLGCQFSLYPMTNDFVDVILGSVKALDPYRGKLRIETDDLSTLIVGDSEAMFDALRDCFVEAAGRCGHVVMSISFSRGCPGEPDDPLCRLSQPAGGAGTGPAGGADVAAASRRAAPATGIRTAAQIALYPLGRSDYMDEIAACIAFAKAAGVFSRPKHFCSRLEADAADIFAALEQSFIGFGRPEDHVVLTATLSKGSPSGA